VAHPNETQPDAAARPEDQPLPKTSRKGIGLCLSGGGFRASLFHMGALRRLNELGILNRRDFRTITSVSGGSITAAVLATALAKQEKHRQGPLSTEDWDREGFTPEGPGPYRQFMEIRVFDCWYHDQDIREAIDHPGYLEGPVADLSIGRIPPKGLPYVVGKKAGAPPGSTVQFVITGTPEIVAAVEVPPEGRAVLLAEPPASPTTTLTLDRRTFARLAGGRWSGEKARTIGEHRVEGDLELGNRVLDNMAFTI